MTQVTRKTMLRLAVVMGALCLFSTVIGCVAVGNQETAPSPAAVLEIGGVDTDNLPATLEIAVANTLPKIVFDPSVLNHITTTLAGPTYLEYALVFPIAEKPSHLFYAEQLTGIITPTQIQMHAVEQWQENNRSWFTSGPIFQVGSSTPISSTAKMDARVELTKGIELINTVLEEEGAPPHAPDRVLAGETAFLLLSDGNSPTPNYTLVILGAVKPSGELDPELGNWHDDLVAYCNKCGDCQWWCRFFP